MPFLTPLVTKPAQGTKSELTEDLDYLAMTGEIIKVPRGFVCDLASIPRIFQLLIPVNDTHREAATLHDWLYYKNGIIGKHCYSRAECDQLFLQAMSETGVSRWKRYSMFFAVRLGGYLAWAM